MSFNYKGHELECSATCVHGTETLCITKRAICKWYKLNELNELLKYSQDCYASILYLLHNNMGPREEHFLMDTQVNLFVTKIITLYWDFLLWEASSVGYSNVTALLQLY